MSTDSFANNVSEFLNENSYITLIAFICTVASVILAIYFYYKSIKKKKPTYTVRNINIINESIKYLNSIHISFYNYKIDNLSISKIALWNAGKDTINHTDIAKNDKIRIVIDSKYEILDCSILYQKNPANSFEISISKNKKEIIINFDYFDYNEGIVIQLFHTGSSSQDLEIAGSIKSVKSFKRKGIQKKGNESLYDKVTTAIFCKIPPHKFLYYFSNAIAIYFSIYFIYSFFTDNSSNTVVEYSESKILFQKTALFLMIILYFYFGSKLASKTPKGFDIFNEEFLEEKKANTSN